MLEVSRHRPPVSSAPLAVTPANEADILVILSILTACRDSLPALAEDGADTLLRRNVRRGSAAVARLDGCAAGVCVWSPVLRRISLLAVLPERAVRASRPRCFATRCGSSRRATFASNVFAPETRGDVRRWRFIKSLICTGRGAYRFQAPHAS